MRARAIQLIMLVGLLAAGCNFSRAGDDPTPSPPDMTAIIQRAQTQTATGATTTPTATPSSTATHTPPASATPTATLTATPTATVPATTAPAPVPTQTAIVAPPPTFTPVVYVTSTPPPTSAPVALVCGTCGGLRLRESPGTAGAIVTELAANTPLTPIGRTADSVWVQVVRADNASGWVAAEYLVVNIDLNALSVTGEAEDAPVVSGGGTVGGTVSGVSANARQIFLDGLAKGNIPYAFTRVGDSITASPKFLTPIGQGSYSLGDYGYLGSAISFFSGPNGRGFNPFLSASIAARNGWSTESVLNPANADSGVCRPGETPLECEYRLVRPAVALIMFGTNDSGGMPSATFQANLQSIVQRSINMGVIPVLSTIPPKNFNPATDGRVAEFNQIIVATARAYDVPLWDYYSAMVNLPNQGLDRDGVHPSPAFDDLNAIFDEQHLQYGYPMRNLTALQVLYTLWQQVLYDAGEAIPATSPPDTGQPGIAPDGDCSSAPPARLAVGAGGRITPGLPNKLRSAPGTGAAQVGSIPGEAVFSVIGGPQCADGYRWWQIDYGGQQGWTASGSGDEYWVEPYP